MSATAGIDWAGLEDAFGRAYKVPTLLDAVSRAGGNRLHQCVGDLCDHVLHQGTIYSASPPAVHELIAMSARSDARDRALFYELLGEFAASARQAIRDGRAIPSCSGGDPADGAAILAEILGARDRFAPDLEHSEPAVRAAAAELLTASGDADAAAIRLVRDRYAVERDPSVRLSLLRGLVRLRDAIADWREFLAGALGSESDPMNRCALRRAELREWKADASAAAVDELVALSVQTGDASKLFGALPQIGGARELAALLQALEAGSDRDLLRRTAERLLRTAFDDRRSGWENVSYSVLNDENAKSDSGDPIGLLFKAAIKMVLLLLLGKMFPFLLRRKLRKAAELGARRAKKIDYWGVEGAAPEIPSKLKPDQQRVLTALANKSELWFDSTNLWMLFGLPETAEGLRDYVRGRS